MTKSLKRWYPAINSESWFTRGSARLETGETVEWGAFSYVVRRGNDRFNHLGKYLEIDRPHRLVFTWEIESESENESVVTIDIEPTENGCRLMLVHEMDPKWAEYTDRTKEGWSSMLDTLKMLLDNKD